MNIIIGRLIIYTLLLLVSLNACGKKKKKKGTDVSQNLLKGKRILMILPERDFNEDEYSQVKSNLEDQGAYVKIASKKSNEDIKGMEGLWLKTDFSWDKIRVSEWHAFVLIGGSGTPKHFEDKKLHSLLKEANNQKKWIASICLSPMILAQAGILIGKKATCFPSIQQDIREMGVKIEDKPVVVDKTSRIVTGRGPKAAYLFSFKLIEMLSGKKVDQARENE